MAFNYFSSCPFLDGLLVKCELERGSFGLWMAFTAFNLALFGTGCLSSRNLLERECLGLDFWLWMKMLRGGMWNMGRMTGSRAACGHDYMVGAACLVERVTEFLCYARYLPRYLCFAILCYAVRLIVNGYDLLVLSGDCRSVAVVEGSDCYILNIVRLTAASNRILPFRFIFLFFVPILRFFFVSLSIFYHRPSLFRDLRLSFE